LKQRVVLLLGIGFALGACQTAVRFVDHPRPDLSVDFTPFENSDCPENEFGTRNCSEGSELWELECDTIEAPSGLLGGFDPAYPIATCYFDPLLRYDDPGNILNKTFDEGNYFYVEGGFIPRFVRYVVYQDGTYTLVSNEDELKALFGPIESPEEALSFAIASTDSIAAYNYSPESRYEYEVEEIEDTHVIEVDDGFLIHLYHYQLYGCGPHYTSLVIYHLSNDGTLQEQSRTNVFRDPEEDLLCVD
jgi:hypothetical protein